MDLLKFPFQTPALKSIQSEIAQLTEIPCSVLVEGGPGSGKSAWADLLIKARGPFLSFNRLNAFETTKEWKTALLMPTTLGLLFEDIDQWSDAQRFSLMQFLSKHELVKHRCVTTSTGSLEALLPQLYYRLATRKIELPDVQNCTADFISISNFWLEVHSLVYSCPVPVLTDSALSKLEAHQFRGGWMELVMLLERSVSFKISKIEADHIHLDSNEATQEDIQAGLTLAEMEKKLILQTLQLTASNKSQAARILGISIRTLRNKLNEYSQRGTHELI